MLSEQDKREMLEDAKDPQRRRAFAVARERSLKPMKGPEYLQFLQNIMRFFPQKRSPHKITGGQFKL